MSTPYLLGLTGSIGMGKSTTAAMFADLGIPVWDADAAVDRLYSKGGDAVPALQAAFPGAIVDGAVDRDWLKTALKSDPAGFQRLEQIVHPLVRQDRVEFIKTHADHDVLLFDIPLLFETNAAAEFDGVAVVSTDGDTQRARVLARPGMDEATFAMILERQMPDAEKRARADYIIPTDSLEIARQAVQSVLAEIRGKRCAKSS